MGMRRGPGPELNPIPLPGGLSSIPGPSISPFPTQPALPELTQGPQFVQQDLQSTFFAPALTLRHQIAVSFTVSGLGAQPPIMILTQLSQGGRDRERKERRGSERKGEQAEAGAQEVGGGAGAGVAGKGEGGSSSAGSLGSTKVSSALSAEAPHPELLQNPLPSPSQAGVGLPEALSAFAPYLVPQILAFAEPALLGLPVISKLALANHFLHLGPRAGHSQDLSFPGSTAYNSLALSPPRDRTCPGRNTFL